MNSQNKEEPKLKTVEELEKTLDPTSGFRYQNQLLKIKMVKYIKSMAKGHTRDYVVAETQLHFGFFNEKLVNGLIDWMIKNGDLQVIRKEKK